MKETWLRVMRVTTNLYPCRFNQVKVIVSVDLLPPAESVPAVVVLMESSAVVVVVVASLASAAVVVVVSPSVVV